MTRAHPAAISDTAFGDHGPDSAVSADGRYVAFVSNGTNLLAGFVSTSYQTDNIYLLDRATGAMTLVSHSVASPLQGGHQDSSEPAISADGRYVAFLSNANDLVPNQSGSNYANVFVFDRPSGTTRLASHASGSWATGVGYCSGPLLLSATGSQVAFQSTAPNLVTGQSDVWSTLDVFLYDSSSGLNRLASHTPVGPATTSNRDAALEGLSADGSLVAISSDSTNLVTGQVDTNASTDVFVFDTVTDSLTLASHKAALALFAADGQSLRAALSADGSSVAFLSDAEDLVPGQTGGDPYGKNAYLLETGTNLVRLVSHTPSAPTQAANDSSSNLRIAANGSAVAFQSRATDLVAAGGNNYLNVFVHDTSSDTNSLVSQAPTGSGIGGTLSGLSADARYVSYESDGNPGVIDTNQATDVFVFDRTSASTRLISSRAGTTDATGNSRSFQSHLSADGQHVVFSSAATNLAPGAVDTNGRIDVFAGSNGSSAVVSRRDAQAPAAMALWGGHLDSVSDNGRFVVFSSISPDLVPGFSTAPYSTNAYLFDRSTTSTTLVSHAPGNAAAGAGGAEVVLSGDGRWIAFTSSAALAPGMGAAGPYGKVYLYERATGLISLATHAAGVPTIEPNGECHALSLSSDGRYLLVSSNASNLVSGADPNWSRDLFVFDRVTDTTTLVTHAAGQATTSSATPFQGQAVLSADGRFVAYEHHGTDLVAGQVGTGQDAHVFLYDRVNGANVLVDRQAGTQSTAPAAGAQGPSISADGSWVTFVSGATNLVSGQVDTNGVDDVFVFDRASGTLRVVSHAAGAATITSNSYSRDARISRDGRWVAFASYSTDLVADVADTQDHPDVFLYDHTTGNSLLVSHSSSSTTQPANDVSWQPTVNADGSAVAFSSAATDLVRGTDSQFSLDAFRFSRATSQNVLASPAYGTSTSAAGRLEYGATLLLSADGSSVVYASASADLAPNDLNYVDDIFMYTSQHVKGDLNDDLNTDLLLRSVTQPVNRVWTLDGDANRVAEIDVTPDQSSVDWELVASDDFNADLHSDLVFRNRTTGAVEFWLMNGTTRQGAPVPFGPPTPLPALNWQLAATADFNSDGKPDLLWRNTATQQLQVWTLSGTSPTGTITPTPAAAAASNWEVVAALDLDLDGNTDLLWYNTTSGRVVRWLMNAQVQRTVGEFTNPMQAGNNNWKVLAGGDYGVGPAGLPGTRDLVWRNASSGNYVIWHMDTLGNRTSGRFTNPAAPASALSWTIAGPR